jgi:RimJ/RimL family protein N-acetyltransferase
MESPLDVRPIVLAGAALRLEPLTLAHAPRLWPHVDPEIFRHTLEAPRDASYAGFEGWMRAVLAAPDSMAWALVLRATGEAVGVSGYLEIRPAHRGLEVGRTWIGRAHQGTRVNPESKYLLLRHAFEALGAVRVQLKTDRNNLRSQAAIAKLGARHEGVLRKYQTRSNGTVRDTVVYSILAEEWPAVKAGLEARLAALPGLAPSPSPPAPAP